MPIIIEIIDSSKNSEQAFKKVFKYFRWVDEKFSPYKAKSEVTLINDARIKIKDISSEMKLILELCAQTKKETNNFFDVFYNNAFDPSGLVKGWAIYEASKILDKMRLKNYYINAGGDIQTKGLNAKGEKWAVGIKNPFNVKENIKIVYLSGEGIATSGIYEKGNHIYNPRGKIKNSIVSVTIIGKNIYEADRFATPAFAMGIDGINFIDSLDGLEGYMIDKEGTATMTRGFEKYTND